LPPSTIHQPPSRLHAIVDVDASTNAGLIPLDVARAGHRVDRALPRSRRRARGPLDQEVGNETGIDAQAVIAVVAIVGMPEERG